MADIHKAAGILLRDRTLLVTRSRGKMFFVSPGGKVEAGESAQEALIRELREELAIAVAVDDLEHFGTFTAPAAGAEEQLLSMDVFIVRSWEGEPRPNTEVEEIAWINSILPDGMELGSIFNHEVIPRLKERGLIA